MVSSSSLSPSLHKRPTSGHSHQWYNSEPVTKSESHRLRTGDIACNSGGYSATTELLFARESECVTNIRSFPLKDSADNSRLGEKRKSHLPVIDEYRYSVLGRRCDATRLKRESRTEALNPIRPLFKDQSITNINKPKCKSESGADLAQQISGIHSTRVPEIGDKSLKSLVLVSKQDRRATEYTGMFCVVCLHIVRINSIFSKIVSFPTCSSKWALK